MRFLLCSLDSPGFLFPLVGLANELRARGHEVRFVTDVKFAEFVRRQGFERISCGVCDGNSFNTSKWSLPPGVEAQLEHIEYALGLFPADALLGQCLTYGPLLAAERHGLPVALMGLSTFFWPSGSDRSCDETAPPPAAAQERLDWRFRDMLRLYNEARNFLSFSAIAATPAQNPLLGDLFLLRSVPALEPLADSLPNRVHFVGGCLWEPETVNVELERWLSEEGTGDEPVVYVHHGKFFHVTAFWRNLVDGLGALRVRVVATLGQMRSDIGPLPPRFFARFHLHQGQVLTRSRLLVGSGNTTAVLGALSAGIPSLLIPAGGEQPEVAEMGRRAGFARVLAIEEANSERIRSEVETLLHSDQYSDRAAYYRSRFAELNGFRQAADLLEQLVTTRAPVLRSSRLS